MPVSGPLTDAELRASAVPVSLAGVPSHAVTNAGTFAVQESGGALTALQVIDDWDESDRAKVNLIAGQAGVSAGAGNVAANTPRVVIATDQPPFQVMTTGNEEGTALGVVVGRTATTSSATFTNDTARGALFFLNITSAAGGGQTLLFTVEAQDPVGGGWVVILTGTATTAAALTGYALVPGTTAATSGVNNVINVSGYGLPRKWRVTVIHSGGGAWTYSVGYSTVL